MNSLAGLILIVFFIQTPYSQNIKPYLQTPTPSSIWVSWKTSSNPPSNVYYGTTPSSSNQVGQARPVQSLDTNYFWHTVKLTNLTPNTVYYYQVSSGSESSEVLRFKSAPALGVNTGNLRFIIIGDHEMDNNRYDRLIGAARDKALELYGSPIEDHINLVVNVGDMVMTGKLFWYETAHFGKSALLSGNIPFMTTVGNHEYFDDPQLTHYFAHFVYDEVEYNNIAKPDGENYYAFQYGNLLFMMLDVNGESTAIWDRQKNFLDQVIQTADSDPTIGWIFGDSHTPYYMEHSSGSNRNTYTHVREVIVPTLVKSKKSVMHITAHAHLYARGSLLDKPFYLLMSGGATYDERFHATDSYDYLEIQKTIERHIYQIVDIDVVNQEMHVQTYTTGNADIAINNELIDEFYIKVNAQKPNKPSLSFPKDISLPFTFNSSPYSGIEPYNSTHFQISEFTADFTSNLVVDLHRDYENLFKSSGDPTWTPVDLNLGKDIFQLDVEVDSLIQGPHFIRVRHRDRSMHWSDWSDPVAFNTTNGSEQPSINPIAYYPMDGDAQDVSGNGQHGTPENISFNNDALQGGVAESGGNGTIAISNGTPGSMKLPTKKITAASWVYIKDASNKSGIVSFIHDDGPDEQGWILGIRNQKLMFALNSETSTNLTYLENPENIQTNNWYHVAGVYNGNTMYLYVNGELKFTSSDQSGNINYPDNGWFQIGSFKDANEDLRLNGKLDDVAVWDRALSAAEIQRLYGGGSVPALEKIKGFEYFRLLQAIPNPFRSITQIKFIIPPNFNPNIKSELIIYSLSGEQLTKIPHSFKKVGVHQVYWDGTDNTGNSLQAGNYILTLSQGNMAKSLMLHKLKR